MRRLLPLLVCLVAAAAPARVISYAPYSDRLAFPAVQHRMNRHFVLAEINNQYAFDYRGQLVLYDSQGLEEPRVIYPAKGVSDLLAVAAREDANGLTIFVQTSSTAGVLSVDSGATWKPLVLPTLYYGLMTPWANFLDSGGPYVRGRYSRVRIGTAEMPFVFSPANGGIYGLAADGTVKMLSSTELLAGTSRDGAELLVRKGDQFSGLRLDGTRRTLGTVQYSSSYDVDGWITPSGAAYVETATSTYYVGAASPVDFYYLDSASAQRIPLGTTQFVSAPTFDYSGAWIAALQAKGTTLCLHSQRGLIPQWLDPAQPLIEALHAGASGKTLLIQVHRPRPALDAATFKDPALAVWHIGQPRPAVYDELYLEETDARGFVHVDVDAIESGEPFVFDSGLATPPPTSAIISPAPPAAGGGDVLQEWGVVRASLAQRLVLPGVAHAPGAFGSFWTTDVTFYNPADAAVNVTVRYAPNGGGPVAAEADQIRTVTLRPQEIRLVRDVLRNLFGFDGGAGALYLTPDVGAAINITSRTYTPSPAGGTYGYGMNAIDVFAAAGPRFPVTFSGAFPSQSGYRTNLALTDVSGRGAGVTLSAWHINSTAPVTAQAEAPVFGAQQLNFLGDTLKVDAFPSALLVQPTHGEVVAGVFTVDNRTNDATYFPPDLPLSLIRTIPVITHVDGVNGSHFRSDLYLFNNSSQSQSVRLEPRMWDTGLPASVSVTLPAHESRVIPDVLSTLFGRTGTARLRITTQGGATDPSVRATSRTYTVDASGGTYGCLLPPLNSFQNATAGDTLEILGPVLFHGYRTNLGIADVSQFGSTPKVRVDIQDHSGAIIDSFTLNVPSGRAGVQMNDIFHARGIPDANTPVLIRLTVLQGSVGAYAVMLDNATNDPTYFAANLGGKG